MNEIVVPTKLIFHVFGAIAHFERRLIGERTKDGLAAAKAKGASQAGHLSIRTSVMLRSSSSKLVFRRPRPLAKSALAVPPG